MLFDDWNNGMFMPEIIIEFPRTQFGDREYKGIPHIVHAGDIDVMD